MGEGRAVEGRQANPSVCLATPFHSGLPGAPFCTRHSPLATRHCSRFLPGARNGQCRAQTSIAKPLSNRELELLEPRLTLRKQTIAPRSNRELSTNLYRCNSHAVIATQTFLTGLPRAFFAKGSVCASQFLTGSGSQTEFAVTHSKQTTAPFLPEMCIRDSPACCSSLWSKIPSSTASARA